MNAVAQYEEMIRIHESSFQIPTFLRKANRKIDYSAVQARVRECILNQDPLHAGDIIDACINLSWSRCAAGPVWDI